jgi:hypothetical protein
VAATAGTYYLVVLGNNGGDKTNAYDLWWANVRPPVVSADDAYEENDTFAEANAPGDAWKGHWLSTVNGAGILADDDWYQINVPEGFAHVVITCSFAHAQGNIDLALYNAGGRIADSMGTGDEEVIDCAVPGPGTYAIAVDGDYATNAYDLWWDATGTADDSFEFNNSLDTAYYPGYDWSGEWLSVIGGGGGGIQRDEDWYRVAVAPGQLLLVVTCSFTHAEGDIDLDLYDADSNLLMRSSGTTDGETISYLVPSPGAYYVKVYGYFQGGNLGSAYDLQYQTEVTDDAYEDNDVPLSAYNLGAAGGIWLSSLSGIGVQGDEDWYQFSVLSGHLQVAATCTFTHAEGNIDLALWSTNAQLASSEGITDSEAINFNVSTSGVYYLRVWGDNLNNAYDLCWSALQPLMPAVPVIVQFQVSRSNLEKRVVVQTEQGRIYRLQGTTNPLGASAWTEADATVAVGSETDLRDTNQNHTAYFYRIQAQPVSQLQPPITEQGLLDSTVELNAGFPQEIFTDLAPADGRVVVTITWDAIDLVEGGEPITIPLRIVLNDGLLSAPAAASPWIAEVGGIAANEPVQIQIYDDVADTFANVHIVAVWHAE